MSTEAGIEPDPAEAATRWLDQMDRVHAGEITLAEAQAETSDRQARARALADLERVEAAGRAQAAARRAADRQWELENGASAAQERADHEATMDSLRRFGE